ncbi:hypothetical protein DEM27_31835 [Metarhizobium album]|uniref:DUF7666 domain-containing protein n=1 Tax=Metarhizobium album TaxID=2182425 RepID=A0A2U2DGA7_9HYPH|nr:hypothetical protein [Rhizobium album]PWE52332.1 hypothetical protein DEM27_31835 [Rhizobium album]
MARSAENDDARLDATPAAKLVTYKGYNKDLSCSPDGVKFQYEIGKTYDNGGRPVRRCGDGAFHSVEMPMDAWSYYGPAKSRYTLTEAFGDIARDANGDSKIASAKITIGVELSLGDQAHSATTGNRAHSDVKGANSVAVAVGRNSTATAHEGGAISLAAYDDNVWPPKLVAVRSSLVGENGIEPGKKYRLTTGGEFELAA